MHVLQKRDSAIYLRMTADLKERLDAIAGEQRMARNDKIISILIDHVLATERKQAASSGREKAA